MTKYIRVEWPEYQTFIEHLQFNDRCVYDTNDNTYFIPEDLYDEVTNPHLELPEEYKDKFTLYPTQIKRGQNVLIIMDDTEEFRIVKAVTSWNIHNSMPLLFEDRTLLEGLNCEIIGVEKE